VANEDQHELDPGATDMTGQLPQGISPRGAARRRFGKAGLGASGVILTLASQPGMATEKLMCTTVSAYGSFTPSSHQLARVACNGLTPAEWTKWLRQWRGAYSPRAKCGHVFRCVGKAGALAPRTLLEVLDLPAEYKELDRDNVAMYLVAALLNATTNRVPQLPKSTVLEIWEEYARTEHYSPRKNIYWDGQQIVEYLKSTMRY
jgi:hypothetical protein